MPSMFLLRQFVVKHFFIIIIIFNSCFAVFFPTSHQCSWHQLLHYIHKQTDSYLLQAAAYVVQLFIILSAQSAS